MLQAGVHPSVTSRSKRLYIGLSSRNQRCTVAKKFQLSDTKGFGEYPMRLPSPGTPGTHVAWEKFAVFNEDL